MGLGVWDLGLGLGLGLRAWACGFGFVLSLGLGVIADGSLGFGVWDLGSGFWYVGLTSCGSLSLGPEVWVSSWGSDLRECVCVCCFIRALSQHELF